MTSFLSKLGWALKRYSVLAGTIGGSLTALSTQINAALAPLGAHIPDHLQNGITMAAGIATASSVIVGAVLNQATVASYNPQTHELKPLDPPYGSTQ